MRPTRFGVHGAVFYAAMLLAFFAFPYSNLFFLLLAFLGVVAVAGIVGARRNLRGVAVRLGRLAPVPTGARQGLEVELAASGRGRFQLTVRLSLAGRREVEGRLDLLDGQARLALDTGALPRGCHALERARLESTYPFGIVRATRRLALPEGAEVVVYPAPLGSGADATGSRSTEEALEELLGRPPAAAEDLQPSGLRDHRPDDGLRRVHWRASARRGRLVVQEWEGEGGAGLEVVLDRRAEAEELEVALATLSALVGLAREGKRSLRILTQGLRATFGEGQRPWSEALRFLASAELLDEGAPPPPAASPGVVRLPRPASVAPAQAAALASGGPLP